MKTKVKIFSAAIAAIAFTSVAFLSCKKDMTGPGTATTSYNLFMTDAPAVYQQVNVNITGAQVHSDITGWTSLTIHPGIYDLLTLANGKDTLLASGLVTVGHVSQIRLVLGNTGNTVMVNGTLYPLLTPSDQQSGLKLNVDANLMKGAAYSLTIDFDAGMSVVSAGNNTYILKPVIRAVVGSTSGSIKGTLAPFSMATVLAVNTTTGEDINDSDDISGEGEIEDSASAECMMSSGDFEIHGLASGTYNITITPQPPYSAVTVANVNVISGQVTDMGSITLH